MRASRISRAGRVSQKRLAELQRKVRQEFKKRSLAEPSTTDRPPPEIKPNIIKRAVESVKNVLPKRPPPPPSAESSSFETESAASTQELTTKSKPKPIYAVVLGIVLTTFLVLVYLYIKKNPRKCTTRQCELSVSAGDNALGVVAKHLGDGCSRLQKSQAVRAAISRTLDELT